MGAGKQDVFDIIFTQEEAAFERWYRGDPSGYLELMAEEMTYITPFESSRVESKSEVEALFAPLKGVLNVPAFEIVNPKLQLGKDIGVFSFILNECDQDGAVTASWKTTEIYRQKGSDWRMIHAHWSANSES